MIYVETIPGAELNPEETEIFRYLGYGCALPDDETKKLVKDMTAQLKSACTPKACFCIAAAEPWLRESRDLLKATEQSETVLLFCASLGVGADRMMQKYSESATAKAVVAQAIGAAMIEEWCDILTERIEKKLQEEHKFLGRRFSPGYGDFPLTHQKRLLALLDAHRKIGVSLTDSFLMLPTKSVSAVCGILQEKPACRKSSCETCQKTDCTFKKEDQNTSREDEIYEHH